MSDILITTEGTLGHITLNRLKALNALTMDMLKDISNALAHFADHPSIAAVLITGAGERSFCAGGDIRALYECLNNGTAFGEDYFQAEYSLNYQVANFPKPYIAFMDGITMGGGVGVSAHGTVRVVTERTRLAMPEVSIGLFPDIGSSWLLARAPGELGTYLALTGATIGAADAIFAGLADDSVSHSSLADLQAKLTTLSTNTTMTDIQLLVGQYTHQMPANLVSHMDEINHYFRFDTVEDILAALAKSDTIFAKETTAMIQQKSPTSLKVTLRLIRLARQAESVKVCLERDYAACQIFLKNHDLYEGIRAAIIDKDRNPQWQPNTLKDVSNTAVDAYFQPSTRPLFDT